MSSVEKKPSNALKTRKPRETRETQDTKAPYPQVLRPRTRKIKLASDVSFTTDPAFHGTGLDRGVLLLDTNSDSSVAASQLLTETEEIDLGGGFFFT